MEGGDTANEGMEGGGRVPDELIWPRARPGLLTRESSFLPFYGEQLQNIKTCT